jgi:hypothetical protein
MRPLLRTRWVRVALAVVLALAIAGGAFAYFTASGAGSGSASASTAQEVTLSVGTPTTQLYPGASADVKLTASNPNPFDAYVFSLALDTSQGTDGFAVDGGHSGCDVSALAFATQSAGWVVPPKVGMTNGTLSIDLTNAISMGAAAANACQGATFTVYLKVGP